MTPKEAREYVNKRFNEIELTDPVQKINIILQELRREGFITYLDPSMPNVIQGISKDPDGGIRYHVQ